MQINKKRIFFTDYLSFDFVCNLFTLKLWLDKESKVNEYINKNKKLNTF